MHRENHPGARFARNPIPLARKLLSLALSLLLLGSLSLPAWAGDTIYVTPAKDNISYSDVPRNSSLYPAVQYVTNARYMDGVGNGMFDPNGILTNAEIVTMLHRVTGKEDFDYFPLPYSDVPAEKYYTGAVKWATAVELSKYFTHSATLFYPKNTMSRLTIAELLWRFSEKMRWDTTVPMLSLPYTDTKNLSSDQISALKWCYRNNIMRGTTSTTFSPNGTLTRRQFATILKRIDNMVCQDTAFCVGTKYSENRKGKGYADTRAAAETARDCYLNMGYAVSCCLEPTITTMRYTHKLRSNIVMLCGHGTSLTVSFKYKDDEAYRVGVCLKDIESDGYTFAGLEGRMGLVDLIVFGGCNTAKLDSQNRCLAKSAALCGAKVSIGWKEEVLTEDMMEWLENFNEALAEGKTVSQAADKADEWGYGYFSKVKQWHVYYSDYEAFFEKSLIRNKSKGLSSSDAALNSAQEPKELLASYRSSRQLRGVDLASEAAAVLAEIDPAFRAEDYAVKLYGQGESIIIDFGRLIGGFVTDSIYTVSIENNRMTAVYDHTKPISAAAEAKACAFSSPEPRLREGSAGELTDTEQSPELTKALRLAWEETQSCPDKEADQQTYGYYYDLDRNQPCIVVLTSYYYDGTETKGLDEYVYDLKNEGEIS